MFNLCGDYSKVYVFGVVLKYTKGNYNQLNICKPIVVFNFRQNNKPLLLWVDCRV